jgi:hypothetical protein
MSESTWLNKIVVLVKLATSDYLLLDLCLIVKEFLRQQLYLIGGGNEITVWDGLHATVIKPDVELVTNDWPCVFLGPDQQSICIAGGLTCVNYTRTHSWQYDLVSKSSSKDVQLKGLKELLIEKKGAVVVSQARSNRPFSIFIINLSYVIQLFPDTGRTVTFPQSPQSPITMASGACPVYDARNDVIWILGYNDRPTYAGYNYCLVRYSPDNLTCNQYCPTNMKPRSAWTHLCLPTHANVVYVVGGDEQCQRSSIEEYNVVTNDWRSIYFETPLIIPSKIVKEHELITLLPIAVTQNVGKQVPITSVTNWRHVKFIAAVFNDEILFVNGEIRADYLQVTYRVHDFSDKLITSYNPITAKRTIVTIFPTPQPCSTPFVV